jgi:hypothetical protein
MPKDPAFAPLSGVLFFGGVETCWQSERPDTPSAHLPPAKLPQIAFRSRGKGRRGEGLDDMVLGGVMGSTRTHASRYFSAPELHGFCTG